MAAETTLESLINRLLNLDNIIQEQNDRRCKLADQQTIHLNS